MNTQLLSFNRVCGIGRWRALALVLMIFGIAIETDAQCTLTSITVESPPGTSLTSVGTSPEGYPIYEICLNDLIELEATGSGPSMYEWDNDGGGATGTTLPLRTATLAPSTSTNYTVSELDAGGIIICDLTVRVNVIQPQVVTSFTVTESSGFDTTDEEICDNDTYTITANVPGCTTCTYCWETNSTATACSGTFVSSPTSAIYTSTGGGAVTYALFIQGPGVCITKVTKSVTENPLPIGSIVAEDTSGDTDDDMEICAGDDVTLIGMGGNSYTWDNATGPQIIESPTTTTTYNVTVTDIKGCEFLASETITVHSIPKAIIVETDASGTNDDYTVCLPGGTATLDGADGTTPSTGTAPLTYTWGPTSGLSTTASTNPATATPTANTTYTLTVTDGNGCTDTETVDIEVSTPQANISHVETSGLTSNDQIICNGDAVMLTATGGVSYTWGIASMTGGATPTTTTSPTSTFTDSPTNTGTVGIITYSVTVTDAAGCTAEEDIDITVHPGPTASITSPAAPSDPPASRTICSGDMITLTATGGGTYTWSTLETPTTLSGTTGATVTAAPVNTTASQITVQYIVTVEDANGCTDTEMIDILVDPLPIPVINAVETSGNATNDAIICEGDDISFNFSGGTSYSWSWTDTTIPTGSQSGTGTSTIVFTPSANQTLSVTVTDGQGCIQMATLPVSVKANPVAGLPADYPACEGDPISLTATPAGATSYSWNDGVPPANTQTATLTTTATATNTYIVTVTNTDGCTSEDDILITVNPMPNATVASTDNSGNVDDDRICPGGTANLLATGAGTGGTYAWSPSTGLSATNIANPTASPTVTTTYTVIVTDAFGCTSELDITIIVDTPTSSISFLETSGTSNDDGSICIGDMVTLVASSGTIYDWGGGITTQNNVVSPTTTTTYMVTVTNIYGCTSIASETVTVNPLPITNPVTLRACEVSNGDVTFDLTDAESTSGATNTSGMDVDNGSTTATVTYHTAMPTTDASGNLMNQITPPTSYLLASGTSFPVTIIARVEDGNGCVEESNITLEKATLPTGTQPVTLKLCDNGAGSATFDLTDAEDPTATSNIVGAGGTYNSAGTLSGTGVDVDPSNSYVVTYYTAPSPGGTLIPSASATAHTISSTPSTVTARITTTDGCFVEETITLEIAPLPIVSPVTLRLCDDGDGKVNFDLTDAEDPNSSNTNNSVNYSNISGTDIDGDGAAAFSNPIVSIDYYISSTTTSNNLVPNPSAHLAEDGDMITAVLTTSDGCTRDVTITINVDEPAAFATILESCDDGNGNGIFNLTDAADAQGPSNIAGIDVDGNIGGATVTYYSPPGTLLTSAMAAAFSASNGMTVVARVTATGGCFSETIITLQTTSPTSLPVTLEACDNGTGVAIFNLPDAESASATSNVNGVDVTNGASGVSVTYHNMSPAAPANMISSSAIGSYSAPATANTGMDMDMVYALVTRTDGCTSEAEIKLIKYALPVANSTGLTLCEDVTGGGTATFTLTDAETAAVPNTGTSGTAIDIDGASTTNTVAYFTSSGGVGPITGTHVAMDGDIIYGVVTDPATGCTAEATVILTVNENPTVLAVTLEVCDDGSGNGVFNLEHAHTVGASNTTGSSVDVVGGNTVTYYTTMPSATGATQIPNGSGAGNTQMYTAANNSTVYALVANTDGCTNEVAVTLTMTKPVANAVTLRLCDTDTDNTNTVSFDLTDAEDTSDMSNADGSAIDVDGGSMTNMVAYFTTTGGVGPISGLHPANDGDIVFAVVTNPSTSCTSEVQITLDIEPLPTANALTLEICEDAPGSAMGTFTLEDAADPITASNIAGNGSSGIDVDGGSTTNTVAYFDNTIASGTATAISSPYIAADNTTIYAVVTDPATLCVNEVAIMLMTVAAPAFNDITLELCNDGTNSAIFNIEDAESTTSPSNNSSLTVNNGLTANMVTYYTASPSSGGTLIPNPTIYQAADGGTVIALITAPNGCTLEATITFELLAPTANDITLELCDDSDGQFDGIATFTLSDAETVNVGSNTSGMEVDDGTGHTVTYHAITPAVGTAAITNIPATDGMVVYALVDSMGCKSESKITLKVNTPVANDVTLIACGTGTVNFNLEDADLATAPSNQTGVAVNGTGISVTYYETSVTPANLISPATIYPAIDNATVIALVTDIDGCTNQSTITLKVSNPTISANTTTPTVCEGDNIVLTSTFTAGASAVAPTYSWTGPNTFTSASANPTFVAAATSGGTYNLMITDANGCTAIASTVVAVDAKPTVTLTDPADVCLNATQNLVTFTGNPLPTTGTMGTFTTLNGLTDNNNGTATLDITVAGVGTHTVMYTYKGANGCENTVDSSIEIFDIPTVAPVNTAACIGSTITIDGIPSGGSGTYSSHAWTIGNANTTGAINSNLTVSNTSIATFDATGLTAGTVELNYVVTDNNSCTGSGSVMVSIFDNPIAAPVGPVTVCAEEQVTIDGLPSGGSGTYTTHAWTISNPGTTQATDATNLLVSDQQVATFDAVGLAAGMATLTYTVTDDNGCMTTAMVSVVVNELPATLVLALDTCSADLTTYNVEIQLGANDTIVSVSHGTLAMVGTDVNGLDSFLVSGIASGTTLMIMLEDTLTKCTATEALPIRCDCPVTNKPIAISADPTCPGDSSQLMVMVDSTETVDWYNAVGDTLLQGDTAYWATIPGTYYAVTRDTLTDCRSVDSTEIVFTHHPQPTITILSDTCSADFATYSIIAVTTGDTILVDTGMVAHIGSSATTDTFEISMIPIDSMVTLTMVDTATNCRIDSVRTPPSCDCPTIADPMVTFPLNGVDTTICAMDTLPALMVSVGANQSAYWFNAAGDTIAMRDTSYVPTASGTYRAIAMDTLTNCISDTVDINLTVLPRPILTLVDTTCSKALDTVSIIVTMTGSTTDTLASNRGTISMVGVDSFLIEGILDDSTVILTAVDTMTGCMTTLSFTYNCTCSIPIEKPVVMGMDSMAVCPGDSVDFITRVNPLETVDWYSASGDTLLMGDTLYSTMTAGTYFAVRRNTNSACESMDSTRFVLTNHTVPTPNIHRAATAYCESDTIAVRGDTIANVAYDWSLTGAGVLSDTSSQAPIITGAANGTIITLLVRDTITGCMASSMDTLTIDTIPNITSIAVKCGATQDLYDIEIVTDAASVVASRGTIAAGNMPYTIVGVPKDSTALITLTVGTCSVDTLVQPPSFPTAMAQIVSPICPGDSVKLVSSNMGATDILWTTTGSAIIANPADSSTAAAGAVSGDIFIVTATDSITGCSVTARDTVAVLEAPVAPIVVSKILCKGEPTVFTTTVPAGSTVNWFDTIVGGTPVAVGPSFSSPETTAGTYNYYAQTVDVMGNGCVSPRSAFTLTILPLPNPNVPSLVMVCPGETTVLTPGTFSSYLWSTGATTSTLTVGEGMYFVTVTDDNGCEAINAINVDVNTSQVLTLTMPTEFCTNDGGVALTGGSPAGGVYSGPSVIGGVFNPEMAGAGTHTITYELSGSLTCSNIATIDVTVTAPDTASLALANTYCSTDAAFTLTGGSPAGGIYTFSGSGATMDTSSVFDPALIGEGTHTITYTTGAGTSCASTATDMITVVGTPNASFTPTTGTMVCLQSGQLNLLGGNPTGGTYGGTGVSNGMFDPSVAGIGTHTISYIIGAGACADTATATFTVMTDPAVSLNLNQAAICNNAAPITLSGGSPAGGTYSGTGVSNGQFDPANLGAGDYPIIYTYSIGNNCMGTATATITIQAIGEVSFTPSTTQLCETAGLLTLTGGSPTGGTFSGPGVVGNTFNPATAGAGMHTITYTGGASTCFGAATSTIVVLSPDAGTSFPFAAPALCSNSGPVNLSGGSPAGGTYSGPGVTGTVFEPTQAGAGTHTITYATGCSSATTTIEVAPQLTTSLALTTNAVCRNDGSFTLAGGSPTGGTYSGQGVSNNTFNPSLVGVGTHTITYTIDPGFGCTGTAYAEIIVSEPSTASLILNTTNFCTTSGAITLSGGSPTGGTYSGAGVRNGNVFDPAVAGAGTHTISYEIAGCSNTATASVSVVGVEGANLNLPNTVICDNSGSFALSGGSPAGGTYSGTGVTNNAFDPNAAGAGTHTITYSVEDPCIGLSTATATISVGASSTSSLSLNAPQLCASSSAFALTGGFPAGGTYSGTGVVGGTTFDPIIAGPGTHTINYNANDGCSGIASGVIIVEAAPPTPVLRMASEICVGEDLRLEASTVPNATAYSWSGPNGFTSVQQNPVITNTSSLNAGTYNLIIQVGACSSAMSSLSVNVSNLPQAATIDNSGTTCQGDNFDLTVVNPVEGDTYDWYYQTGAFVGTGTTLTLNSATNESGSYYAVTNRNGCVYNPSIISNAPSFAFTEVVISAQSNIGAFAGQDVTVCNNTYDLAALTPNDPTIFGTWSALNTSATVADPNEITTPVFNLAPGANHFVWTLSNAGCSTLATDTVLITYAQGPVLTDDSYATVFDTPISVDVLANDQFTSGFFLDSVFSTANGTAVINGDQTISYAPSNIFIGTDELTYTVCNNACLTTCSEARLTITVGVNTNLLELALPNTISPNGDGLNDALIIPEIIDYPGSELIVFNRWGDEVYRSQDYQNDWYGFWQDNGGDLPVGTYFYILNINNTEKTRMSGYVYIQRD